VLAQLRDVFAAENSAVVPQKNEYGGPARQKRTENYFLSIAIWKSDLRQHGVKRLFHDVSSLSTTPLAVNPCRQQLLVNKVQRQMLRPLY